MGQWDGKMKHLASAAQEDFVRWLVEGARFEGELSANFATRDRDGDILRKLLLAESEQEARQILLSAQN